MGRTGASRFLALGAFALLVMSSQLLWLSFASITDVTAHALGVSEGAVGDLAVINPAMFVVLAIPTGRWMDSRYAHALAAGAVLIAGGALLRGVDPTSYAWIFAGQAVMSIGQPLVLNASTKIAARHFPPREQTAAISVATAAQFVGILAAVLTSSWLVNLGGLSLLLHVHAAVAVVAGLAVVASLRLPAAAATDAAAPVSLRWLRNDPLMWKLAALLFVGFGSYNALATWLDAIMTDFGNTGSAGGVIAAMTLAGIVGAALLPGLVGARDRRRTLCLAATGVLAAAMIALTLVHRTLPVGVALALVGFTLLGTLPVVLDWSEIHVGPERAGTATGVLLLAGNLGGVLVVLTVQAAIGSPVAALVVMALWAVPGFLVALRLPRRVGGHRTAAPEANGVAAA